MDDDVDDDVDDDADDVDDNDDNIYNDLLSRDKGEKPTLGMERP